MQDEDSGRREDAGRTDRQPPALGQSDRVDRREQLRVRVAWYYHIEGLTQAELAERVGISRSIVNRILGQCRDAGIIQVRVNSPLTSCVELESELLRHYRLRNALVVPSPAHVTDLPMVLGAQAGEFLSDRAERLTSLGIGWGETLWNTLRHVRRMRLPSLSIVSMLGGLYRNAAVSAYETATQLAHILGADCYYMAAPVYVSSEESRRVLGEQDYIREVMDRADRCELALLSAGDLNPKATMRRLGLVSDSDADALMRAGAVGDILGHYLDADGQRVDHPLNRRVIAYDLDRLRGLREVALACGGPGRVPIIRACLRAGYANVLITDEDTARTLVDAAEGD